MLSKVRRRIYAIVRFDVVAMFSPPFLTIPVFLFFCFFGGAFIAACLFTNDAMRHALTGDGAPAGPVFVAGMDRAPGVADDLKAQGFDVIACNGDDTAIFKKMGPLTWREAAADPTSRLSVHIEDDADNPVHLRFRVLWRNSPLRHAEHNLAIDVITKWSSRKLKEKIKALTGRENMVNLPPIEQIDIDQTKSVDKSNSGTESPNESANQIFKMTLALPLFILFSLGIMPATMSAARMSGTEIHRGGYEPIMATQIRGWEFIIARVTTTLMLSFMATGICLLVAAVLCWLSGLVQLPSFFVIEGAILVMVLAATSFHHLVRSLVPWSKPYRYVTVIAAGIEYLPIFAIYRNGDADFARMGHVPYFGQAVMLSRAIAHQPVAIGPAVLSTMATLIAAAVMLWLAGRQFSRRIYLYQD